MWIARDITSIMAAQAKIETINTELEQTVKERTEKLEKTNLQLEGFIATVSHDLRSPLRTMSSYASLIEKYLPADKSNDVVGMLGIIKKSASQMNTIITELLKLAHIGKKQLVEGKVDLTEMVNMLVKDLYQNNKETTTKINVGQLEPCLGDEGMLQQVWVNLLSNAVKYSAKVESPEVNIGMTLSKKGESVYYIHDNGAGFDSSRADNLFKPFRRMHSSDEFEGTGIGLSIVHNIVAVHGGEIWAESKPGQGCTFFLKLKSAKNMQNMDTIVKHMSFNVNQEIIKSGTA
jgi:light-regulated signal transduction histidine kinase (bacteriophytochrome)